MARPLLVALLVGPCRAQGRIDCNALQSHTLGESVHYCVMLPPDYDAATAGHSPRHYPVLYFMHGLGDNEQTLFKSGGWDLIQDLRQKRQVPDFLVVAPEGRRSFYINSADAACDIAISSSASSFLTSSRIIRFDASAPREPLAVFRWADMAPSVCLRPPRAILVRQRAECRAHRGTAAAGREWAARDGIRKSD